MAHNHYGTTAFGCVPGKECKAFGIETATFENAFFTYGQYLEGFHHEVAEIVVESGTDGVDLLFGFMGECIAEVLQYNGFPIAETAVKNKAQQI